MTMKIQIAFNVDESLFEEPTKEASRILNDLASRITKDKLRFNDVYRIFDETGGAVGQLVVSKEPQRMNQLEDVLSRLVTTTEWLETIAAETLEGYPRSKRELHEVLKKATDLLDTMK